MGKISSIRSILLTASIALVFILFVIYGINTLYSEPNLSSFCNESSYERISVSSCDKYTENESTQEIEDLCFCDAEGKKCTSLNPEYIKCKGQHQEAIDKYDFVVFIIMVSIGGVVILGSFFIPIKDVSFGLMGGGLISVLMGAIRNWNNSEDWMKFILFGILLVVLIWFGSRRFNDDEYYSKRQNKPKDYEE